MTIKCFAAILASGVSATALYAPAACAQGIQQSYDIAPQRLSDALRQYSDVSGREVVAASTLLQGQRSARVRGRLSPDAALSRLLSGTGLTVELVEGAWVLREGNGDVAEAGSTEESEAIVVTGTRIRGTGPVGSPVTTVDRDALDRSGRATLADFIQTIPQNFSGGPTEANVGFSNRGKASSNIAYGTGINLRGLGPGATLTLFDGARPALGGGSGAYADVSLVPSIAIDRVEILTDGASAIYGSDAVAGVVNIRLRNRFEGAETRLRAGTADGDYGEVQISQIFGKDWSTGHLVVAGEYSKRGNLAATKRPFASEDLRPFGGPDLRSNYNNPGTIVAANGQRFLIPRGQNGRGLTAAQLTPSADFNRGDARRHTDILPEQETGGLYASIEQALGSHISLFSRALYSEREFEARRRVSGPTPVRVTSANPFYVDPIGTGQPVTVYYDPVADFGPESLRGKAKAFNSVAGARVEIGTWSVELSVGFGRQTERYDSFNLVHSLRFSRAVATSNPAQAINVFGDGAVNDPALIDSLRGSIVAQTRFKVWTGALRADGTLFSLPAGDLKLAVGAEYRRDRFSFSQTLDLVTDIPLVIGIPGLPDKRVLKALYGELVAPIFDSGTSFPGALTVSAAGRYEDYSDFGDTSNPKFGARWTPLPGLALRASYGKSFRAPFFDELVGTANALYQTLRVADPTSPTGQTVVLALFGFRPDLQPERAESWTAGIDFEPRAIPGAKLTLTYFDIRYRDRIASASSDSRNILNRRDLYVPIIQDSPDLATVNGYFTGPNFSNALGVAPGDVRAIIDLRTRNLSSSTIRGLDFDVGYSRPIGRGNIALSLGGTRLFAIDNQITESAPRDRVVGTLGNPVKLRLRGRLGFALDAFDGGLAVNHVGSYRNLTVTPMERVKSWTTFDLQIGARIGDPDGRGLRLGLSINNLFDKDPPYAQFRGPSYAMAYDPEQASAIGRSMALQAIITW
ncbi:TonB-dependent receptor domain-containing protein [Sphingopyxis sp.]|uniref:TonB-dependent receptor domain-containing protein n=1 Tax=Sphingopyxis sp. TaxID=1908224 RepID=UPI0035B2C151